MTMQATFTVYGEHIEELREAAYAQAVRFFRTHDDEILLVDLQARPTVQSADGEPTRWRASVIMRMVESTDD